MSLSTPEIARFEAPQIARLHVVTSREQIGAAMQSALHEMDHVLQGQAIRPTGPWFAHHHRKPTDTFDFDVCFPIAAAVEPTGRVDNGSIPGTEVIRAVYTGPYEGLPQAWPEFARWIEANGYKTREDAFEVYTVGPRKEPNPAHWQTELNYPLAEPH